MRYAVLLGILLVSVPLLLRLGSLEPFADVEGYAQLHESQQTANRMDPADILFRYVPAQLALIILAAATLFLLSWIYPNELFILLFATTPVFLHAFTTPGPLPLAACMIALGILLLLRKQYWGILVIPFCFALGLGPGLLATIAIVSIALLRRTIFVALGATFFALISVFAGSLIISSPHVQFATLGTESLISLFELRAGVTIFLVLLGAIGFLLSYEKDRRLEAAVSLGIVLCSLLLHEGSIIMAAFLAYYGSKGLSVLWKRHWSFAELRPFVMVLIACGILFGCVFAVRERLTIDEDRLSVTKFVLAAYPTESVVATDKALAPIFAYHGYQVDSPQLPGDPTALEIALKPYDIVITTHEISALRSHKIVYKDEAKYTVYEANR